MKWFLSFVGITTTVSLSPGFEMVFDTHKETEKARELEKKEIENGGIVNETAKKSVYVPKFMRYAIVYYDRIKYSKSHVIWHVRF